MHFCHACLNLLMDELAVAQCSSFVKLHEWIPATYFVVMVECCSMLNLLHLVGYCCKSQNVAIFDLLAISKT